jgi:Fructose-2,6-bisphosphatase
MRLYLIRHGESEANLKQMHAGWQDSPLTGKGELQALAVRPIIKNIQFDKIIVSDLSRAKRTVAYHFQKFRNKLIL